MVKEEAIKQLEWYFEEDNGISADSVTKQAFNTIKKALSQESINEIVQKAYEDGQKDGYVQTKVEQKPCDKCAMKNSNSDYCKNCTVAEYHGEKVSVKVGM